MLASPLFESVLDRIESGANAISCTEHARSGELQEVARDVANLEAWLSDTPELRPLGSFARHVKLAIENLIGLFDTTVQILEAPTIAGAQQVEPNLQRHADAAAGAICECSTLINRIEELWSSENPAAAWMSLAIGVDFASAASRGAALLESHGLPSAHDGAAVLALMWDLIAKSTSDNEAFWELVSSHHALLAAHADAVIEITESDAFSQRAADTLDDLLHAARVAITQGDPESQRQSATDLLDFGHRLVEQPLKLHLGIACAATTDWTFGSTQSRDVKALIQIADQKNWCIGSLLGRPDIRNAFAHRDYSVRSDGLIELRPSRHSTQSRLVPVVSSEELCDAVLAISEACGAMDMAYALVTGHSVTDPIEGASPFLLRTVANGLLEWEEIALHQLEDGVIIDARCTPPVKFAAVGTLASFVGDAEHLTIRLATDDAQHEIQLPVRGLKEWSHFEGEVARSTAFWLAWHQATIDGTPAFTTAQVRKALAVQTLELIMDDPRPFSETKHDLASARSAANGIGDRSLAKAIAGGIGWKARVEAGHRPASDPIDRLIEIAATEVEPVTEWIVPA